MGESLSAVVNFAFNDLAINKLEAYTHVKNIGSINLLNKFNFNKKKIIKEKYQSKNGEYGMAVYVLENTFN